MVARPITFVGNLLGMTAAITGGANLPTDLRALVDIDTHEVMRLFKSIPLPKGAKPYGRQDDFLAWLQAEKIVEPSETHEVVEWHIGSYGELESR